MTPVVPEMRTLHPRPLAPAQNARASFPPPGPAAPGRCRRPRPKPAVRKGQRSAPRSARPELVICRSRVVHVRAFSPAAGPRKGVSRGPRTGCAHFQVVKGRSCEAGAGDTVVTQQGLRLSPPCATLGLGAEVRRGASSLLPGCSLCAAPFPLHPATARFLILPAGARDCRASSDPGGAAALELGAELAA